MLLPERLGGVRRTSTALAVLVALCWQPLLTLHADRGDDEACLVQVEAHDSAAHRFSASPQRSRHTDHHCYICHWLGSFRPLQRVRRVEHSALCAGRLLAFRDVRQGCVGFAELPARSPPV